MSLWNSIRSRRLAGEATRAETARVYLILHDDGRFVRRQAAVYEYAMRVASLHAIQTMTGQTTGTICSHLLGAVQNGTTIE